MFAVMLFASCGPNEAEKAKQLEEEQTLWDQTMNLHDETMKMTPYVEKVIRVLKEVIDNPEYADSKQVGELALSKVEASNQAMWDWMHNLVQLEDLRKDKTHEEIVAYLTQQRDAMALIQENMQNDGSNGERTIGAIMHPEVQQQ